MRLKGAIWAASAMLALAIPVAASAEPGWGGHDRDDHGGWHGRGDWRGDHDHDGWRGDRDRDWRGHERWQRGWGGYGYAPRCYWVDGGYYNGWGQYVYRPVRVCR